MNDTARDLIDAIKRRTGGTARGLIDLDGLTVAVRILDARRNFGRNDVLVTPVTGSGERWIDLARVQTVAATSGREGEGR